MIGIVMSKFMFAITALVLKTKTSKKFWSLFSPQKARKVPAWDLRSVAKLLRLITMAILLWATMSMADLKSKSHSLKMEVFHEYAANGAGDFSDRRRCYG